MLDKPNYQGNGNGAKSYVFFDEATKRKIRRHIYDINDVITEKDIKNAKVPGQDEGQVQPPSQNEKNNNKKQVVDDIPGKPLTPWDVVDE